MPSIPSKLADILLGESTASDLEKRILNGAILAALSAHLVLLAEACLQDFSLRTVLLLTAGMVSLTVLYLAARKTNAHACCSTVFLILVCSELLVEWFLLGGRGGAAVPVLILASAVTPGISSSRHQFYSGLALLIATYLILLIGTIFFWEKLPRVKITLENNLEHLFETAIFCAAIIAVSSFIVHSYRRQKTKTARLNKELTKANRLLFQQNEKLREALQEVKTLKGILPVCANCNNIKTEDGTWVRFEKYISGRTEARFSHGICPDCLKKHDPELYRELKRKNEI